MIATAGNHDLTSMNPDGSLPQDALLGLDPPFPFGDRSTRNQYFAEQHAISIDKDSVVVTLNSCAHHGYTNTNGDDEFEHGRVTEDATQRLEASLQALGTLPPFRILLMHHHPLELPDFDASEKRAMKGTDALVRVLSRYGDWLIVHGHKHRGWVHYSAGSGDAPVVLSASAFAADLGTGEFAKLTRRQFHVVEFHDAEGPRGLVHTWSFDGVGWVQASKEHMLSGQSGFGLRTSVNGLAERLRLAVIDAEGLDATQLLTFEPNLPYLSFDDRNRLLIYLRQHAQPVTAVCSNNGDILALQPLYETV